MVNRVTQPFHRSYAAVVTHIFTFMRTELYLLPNSTIFTNCQVLTRDSSRKASEKEKKIICSMSALGIWISVETLRNEGIHITEIV